MFGYIMPDYHSLSEEERIVYRSYYCGLCHSLKNRYSQECRIALSNDMTFLAILLSSLYEPDVSASRSRCVLHPVKPHTVFSSGIVDYAADMNLLLFYYKCMDQQKDGACISGNMGEKVFRKKIQPILSRYPEKSMQVQKILDLIWENEKSEEPDLDLLCNLSGEMLGTCFVMKPDDFWSPQLFSVGQGLGRFIYLIDAWEDYDDDIKHQRFNPLCSLHQRSDYEQFCRETLKMLVAEAVSHFELLPLEKNLSVLRNVLYSGVWQRYAYRWKQLYKKEVTDFDQ